MPSVKDNQIVDGRNTCGTVVNIYNVYNSNYTLYVLYAKCKGQPNSGW